MTATADSAEDQFDVELGRWVVAALGSKSTNSRLQSETVATFLRSLLFSGMREIRDGFELLVRVGTVIVVHAVVLVLTAVALIAGTGVYTYLRPATVTEVPSIPAKKPPIVITPNQNDPAPAETGALISKLQGKEIGVPVYFEGEPYGFVVEVKAEPNGQPRILVVQTLGYEVAGKVPPTFEVPYDSVRWHSKDQLAHDWQVNNETVHATVKSLWVELDGKSTFVPTWKPEKR